MNVRSRLTAAAVLYLVFFPEFAAAASVPVADRPGFTEADNEFYLEETVYAWLRPGVEFELLSFWIPADNRPVVRYSIKDPAGLPLDMDGVYTPGPVDLRFMLTFIPMNDEYKVSYHDRFYDRGGDYSDEGNGIYSYRFSTVLPADFDMDATHTLASVATRDLRDYGLERYYDNDVHNFTPSGVAMTTPPRDIVSTETCNRCHDPLAEHGGRYREVQVCQQCHLPALVDEEDVSFSLDIMTHRVHMEAEGYPADLNDCEVCHTGGTPTADTPMVANPHPVPSCDATGSTVTELVWGDNGPVEIRLGAQDGQLFTRSNGAGSATTGKWVNDATEMFLVSSESGHVLQQLPLDLTVFGCVNNPPGTARGMAADLHDRWMTRPSNDVCQSCHVDVDPETGTNHPVWSNDEFCALCHVPTGSEYDLSVQGSHQVDYKSAQLGGVLVDIIGVSNTGPGQRPVVTFSLSNKWGPLPPEFLGRLRLVVSGPNEDFTHYVREDALGKLVADGPNWQYRFETALPLDAMGSYTVSFEGRINSWTLNAGTDKEFTVRDQAQNATVPFAVTADAAWPRRTVVDDARCEDCHVNLSEHGSNRHDAAAYCQTCHMPSAIGGEGDNPQSIDFRYMVHKIHRGEDLEFGYVIGSDDFSGVIFPGDLRNCESCHVADSYTLPLQAGLENVLTPADLLTEMRPATAACLSCHDSESTAVHADTNSSELGEACATCHGEGKTYSVTKVHAR